MNTNDTDYNQMMVEDDELPQLVETSTAPAIETPQSSQSQSGQKQPNPKKLAKKIQNDPKMIQLAQEQRKAMLNPQVPQNLSLREKLQRKLEASKMSRTSRLGQQHQQESQKSKIKAKINKIANQEVPVENISIDLNQPISSPERNLINEHFYVPASFEEYTKFLGDSTNDNLSEAEISYAKKMVQAYDQTYNRENNTGMKTLNFNDDDDEII